jgi:hypothetical protein
MNTRWIALVLVLVMLAGAATALAAGWTLARQPDAPGLEVTANASGEALVATGVDPYALSGAAPTSGRIDVRAIDAGGRWSALQSKDTMDVTAELTHPRDGATYRVTMTTPMRQEPEGRYTTWFGVGLGDAHHGDTGIDTPALPRVAAELSLWGFADVYRNGQLIAGGKPTHVMAVQKEQGNLPGQVYLSVATEHKDLVSAPDGYLNVIWREVAELSTPATQGIDLHTRRESNGARGPAETLGQLVQFGRRELLGYGVLVFVLAGLLFLVIRPWPTITRVEPEPTQGRT